MQYETTLLQKVIHGIGSLIRSIQGVLKTLARLPADCEKRQKNGTFCIMLLFRCSINLHNVCYHPLENPMKTDGVMTLRRLHLSDD